jgi:hypothetical protein
MKTEKKDDGEITYSDPTMVQVGFSRQTYSGDGASLFGSSVKNSNIISLTIHRTELNRHLSQDWYHANSKPIIEVLLSPLQFAELLTTMNVGFGVPGTLVRHEDEHFDLPEYPSRAEQFRNEAADDLKTVIDNMNKAGKVLEDMLEDPKPMGKQARKELKNLVESYCRMIEDHLPYVLNQFSKQMAKTVTEAKADVDAFVQDTIVKTGIAELKKQAPQIEDRTEDDK